VDDWPPNQDGHVFLARATEQICHKLFGAATWAAELSALDTVLADPVPDISSIAAMPSTVRGSHSIGMFQALHRVARAREAERRNGEARKRLERIFEPVRQVIASSAAIGALQTALRPVPGGCLQPIPPHFWSTDRQRIASRFERCRLSWTTPFEQRPDGSGYIYLEGSGLKALIEALPPAETRTEPGAGWRAGANTPPSGAMPAETEKPTPSRGLISRVNLAAFWSASFDGEISKSLLSVPDARHCAVRVFKGHLMSLDYMTPKEAADYVRSSTSTLAKRRITGQLPHFSRIGKAIRYRRADLDAWMNGNVRRSTSERASTPAHVSP
jgi:excisionase family DNA binding protein